MKKPTLLLQFRTDKSEYHEQKCIMSKGGYKRRDLEIVNVLRNSNNIPKPEDLDNYQAVITGASGQFNTTDWSEDVRTKVETILPLLKEIIRQDKPLLAICFGHQLIANLLGGEVKRDKKQDESGTYKVYLTEDGKKSKLFQSIPNSFFVVSGHKDSVTRLPKKAKLLAYSRRCKVHAYQIKNNIFSIQFHPELDLDSLIWRLKLYPEYLKGKSLDDIRRQYKEIPHAIKIIKNFRDSYSE